MQTFKCKVTHCASIPCELYACTTCRAFSCNVFTTAVGEKNNAKRSSSPFYNAVLKFCRRTSYENVVPTRVCSFRSCHIEAILRHSMRCWHIITNSLPCESHTTQKQKHAHTLRFPQVIELLGTSLQPVRKFRGTLAPTRIFGSNTRSAQQDANHANIYRIKCEFYGKRLT